MYLSLPYYNSPGVLTFYLSYMFSLLELRHFSTDYSLELCDGLFFVINFNEFIHDTNEIA